jgi:hypothetical protein
MVLDVLRSLGAEVDREAEGRTDTPGEEGTAVAEEHRVADEEPGRGHAPRREAYRR